MAVVPTDRAARDCIAAGQAVLGIEFGSTNIKASLIGADHEQLASGSHAWENQYVERTWTYSLEAVASGLQEAVAMLLADAEKRHGVRPQQFAAIGISAMMHGYLAFDQAGELLVPFRTWRNTSTGQASAALTEAFGVNIPLRWSVAHYYQALLDGEEHTSRIGHLTTLAGYVHQKLTGRRVLGVGDASGMFPIDSATGGYDAALGRRFDELAAASGASGRLFDLLPQVLPAGQDAGRLSPEGARLLDPSGTLQPGAAFCPPEGDAGTGMVATNSTAPRTGNVSAGTSIFAMVVLDAPLAFPHQEIDLVATPAGDPVAMVHCNNGASELAAWAGVFGEFAAALGSPADSEKVFSTLFAAALEGCRDGGGLLAYNYLSGEPVTGLQEGRPLLLRTPDSSLNLGNLMRAHIYGVFATLSLGMRILAAEHAAVEKMYAHGGIFRTAGVAQRFLAAALDVPVAVGSTAGHGGAWGIAVLAAYRLARAEQPQLELSDYLADRVFAGAAVNTVLPDPTDVAGYAAYLRAYVDGLSVERAAIHAI
ncbi:xylulokinase [Glutamicibacter soli]|uniref:xylulokinase n=1 Tax=Glutamicibacter soli TaxID=453836 RepID=UPI003FD6934D